MSSATPRADALSAPILAILGATALALALGCATPDPTAVRRAEGDLEAASESPLVREDSVYLQEASRRLERAKGELEVSGDQAFIDHEARMAGMYAMVAVARAEAEAAEKKTRDYLSGARAQTRSTRQAVEQAIRNAEALDAQRTVRGLVLTLGGVQFGLDSAELKPAAEIAVARVAGFLIALQDREVLVEGHTDSTGSDAYNVELSRRRAEAVRDALIEGRIAPSRILAEGYGSAYPVADNDTEQGRAKNRRVEIVILEPGQSAAEARRS